MQLRNGGLQLQFVSEGSALMSGRLSSGPSRQVHEEILRPQFVFDMTHLLPHYLAVEVALLFEYERMGVVTGDQRQDITDILGGIDESTLSADPATNMSDTSMAIEQWVHRQLTGPVPAWHVDRSRNDSQATAHALAAREWFGGAAKDLLGLGESVHRLANATTDMLMPGYTHLQAAQVITPGFYLAALSQQILHNLRRWLATYDSNDLSPLGAGSMAGQQLPWDRHRMAHLLGFAGPVPHALTAVASRSLALEMMAEFSILGAELSRFVTDLMTWGGNECAFIDLPDELSGISAAMPQKKNFPILERIRGKLAHLGAFGVDIVLAQRSTPYSNMVEVSKEATANLHVSVSTTRTALRLFSTVIDNLRFRSDRMREACRREYLGAFTLANDLTLNDGIPWRDAQIVVGQYIAAAVSSDIPPHPGDPGLLAEVAGRHGYQVSDAARVLANAFDIENAIRDKRSTGSVNPQALADLLASQADDFRLLRQQWDDRRERRGSARALLGRQRRIGEE
ncbi:lyase family protein [Micromonospora echinofusca]|uniref:argininosuccinate lyase n=1 Tax=Micromonospora echinofusca TaxID=47858 RepID=UPI00331F5874